MKIFFLFVFLFTASIHPQENNNFIKGRILEESTGMPVPYANVFLSGTTLGSATDSMGNYIIRSIPSGSYQLIASAIGYNSKIKNINVTEKTSMSIDLSVKTRIYEMDEISISAERPQKWDEYFREFRRLFLGNSEFAGFCRILNSEVLSFSNRDNILSASASMPLMIVNEALGYQVECELVYFTFEKKSGRLKYHILPRFTEIIDSSAADYEIRRESVYTRSIQHFLRTLIENNFTEKGYKIYTKTFIETDESENYMKNLLSDASVLITKTGHDNYELKFNNYLKVVNGERISWLKLEYDIIYLNSLGFSNVFTPFEVRGHWAFEGVSTMLPMDFYR
jgi:hypothetical protein